MKQTPPKWYIAHQQHQDAKLSSPTSAWYCNFLKSNGNMKGRQASSSLIYGGEKLGPDVNSWGRKIRTQFLSSPTDANNTHIVGWRVRFGINADEFKKTNSIKITPYRPILCTHIGQFIGRYFKYWLFVAAKCKRYGRTISPYRIDNRQSWWGHHTDPFSHLWASSLCHNDWFSSFESWLVMIFSNFFGRLFGPYVVVVFSFRLSSFGLRLSECLESWLSLIGYRFL